MSELERDEIQHPRDGATVAPQRNTAPKMKVQRIIIQPKRGWQLIDLRELAAYKDVFYFLVIRDISVLYKQTVLGYAWALIRPLVTMILFSVVFGKMVKIPSDGVPYPIFSYAALLPWTYFSTAMASSATSLLTDSKLFTKVYFPRLIIPMTPVLAKLADFGIAFLFLVGMMVWYGITPTINLLFLPFLFILMIVTTAGIGIWLSAMSIQYRDIKHAIPFLTQIMLYGAPVVYPASLVPAKFRLLYGFYPMAGVIEGFRSALIGKHPMPWDLLLTGTLSAFLIACLGTLYFNRKEDIFADVA